MHRLGQAGRFGWAVELRLPSGEGGGQAQQQRQQLCRVRCAGGRRRRRRCWVGGGVFVGGVSHADDARKATAGGGEQLSELVDGDAVGQAALHHALLVSRSYVPAVLGRVGEEKRRSLQPAPLATAPATVAGVVPMVLHPAPAAARARPHDRPAHRIRRLGFRGPSPPIWGGIVLVRLQHRRLRDGQPDRWVVIQLTEAAEA